jgi:acetate---CoA ligase (ADP-forming)
VNIAPSLIPVASHGRWREGMERLLRPRSIAIFGASPRPGTASQIILKQILAGGFTGEIHLVGRTAGQVGAYTILADPADLPPGIDLAILTVPAEGLRDAVEACVDREIGSAVSFASGFAELGEAGRAHQAEIAAIAARGNLALLGPNTVGYYNFVDGLTVMMIDQKSPPPLPNDAGTGLAIVAQSGGIANHVAGSLRARSVPITYNMTTGNEAVLAVSDLIGHFLEDDRTTVVVAYAEQIASPDEFLALGALAKARGKAIVLLHPGRTASGQEAASSHTGSLAGNYAAMALAIERAGILLVETQEELIDLGELLYYFPKPRSGGLALVTTSGAICALSADYLEPRGLEMPGLSPRQTEALTDLLPSYLSPRNPLDLGTLPAWKPEMIGAGAKELLSEPTIGSIIVSLPLTEPDRMMAWLTSFAETQAAHPAPAIFVLAGEDCPLPPELHEHAAQNRIVIMRSNERAIRTLAAYHRHADNLFHNEPPVGVERYSGLPDLGSGTQAEWLGKKALAAIGIATPESDLATSVEEAISIADRIGYPVVMKAQAASLPHKSEVGGVLLSIGNAEALREAWAKLYANVRAARPDLHLDGILVEAMGARGLELVVGATRDPRWGPAVMVGLGGIWVEALQDVRLCSPSMTREEIVNELGRLKAAKLLNGFRGSPAVDIEAVASVVQSVGRLMLTEPDIMEIDINPLVAMPKGQGVIALDALIVCK